MLTIAGITPSVGFPDLTQGNQSPSFKICVLTYRLKVYIV